MILKIEIDAPESFIRNSEGMSYANYVLMCHNAVEEQDKKQRAITEFTNGLLSEIAELKQKLSDAEETIEVMQGGVGHGE